MGNPLGREDNVIQVSDEIAQVFVDTCVKIGLGKTRLFEVAVYHLADRLAASDPAALEAVDMWKRARATMEIAQDAIEVAKMRG